MSQNQQFSSTYLKVEDRLLLRGRFPDDTEVQLLLTRRLTRGLLEMVDRLSGTLVSKRVSDPAKMKIVAEFAREAAVENADYSKAYSAGRPHPLMKNGPRLVTSLSLAPQENGYIAVIVRLGKRDQINFLIAAHGLWSLSHLIAKQAKAAEWDLSTIEKTAAESRIN